MNTRILTTVHAGRYSTDSDCSSVLALLDKLHSMKKSARMLLWKHLSKEISLRDASFAAHDAILISNDSLKNFRVEDMKEPIIW